MIRRQKKRQSWAMYFIGMLLFVQLFSTLIPALPVSAQTAPATNTSIPDVNEEMSGYVAKWLYFRAIYSCYSAHDVGKTSLDNVRKFKWFEVNNDKNNTTATGYVAGGGDGREYCTDESYMKTAHSTLVPEWSDGVKAFCAVQNVAKSNGGSDQAQCETGTKDFDMDTHENQQTDFENAVKNKSANSVEFPYNATSSNKALAYQLWRKSLEHFCGGDTSLPDGASSLTSESDTVRKVKSVDGRTGAVTELYYQLKVSADNTYDIHAKSDDYNHPGEISGERLKCKTLADWTENDAGAYQQWAIEKLNNHTGEYLKSAIDVAALSKACETIRPAVDCLTLAKTAIDQCKSDASVSNQAMEIAERSTKIKECASNKLPAGLRSVLAAIGDPSITAPARTGSSATDRKNTCEADQGSFGWIGCAVLEAMDGVVGFLDSQVRNLLTVQVDKMTANGGLKKAWGVMRNFAYLILVPMMLVMVIGTALGSNLFDAYTVKKALPRMLSAVLFMSISYYLCVWLIELSNAVGTGIFHLITLAAPGGDVSSLTQLFGGGEGGLFLGLSTGGLVVGAAIGAVTWGILGSFALVTIGALLLGYVTLVIRQVLIILLVVLSPIAILVWIFPGNDKLWTVWKTTFIAMLMMFPLIMVLIASGRFFAATADTIYDGPTGVFIKLIAYIAPYFFIPATFKAGMGAFNAITGAVNDRGRGFFEKQRKGREATRAQGWQNFKSGTGVGRFRQSAAIRRTGMGVGAGMKGRYGMGERGAQARSQIAGLAAQEQIMKNPLWSQIQENDDALHALTYGSQGAAVRGLMQDRGWDKDRAERAAAAAGASVRYGQSQAIAAAQQLATTGTGYATHMDADGNRVSAMEDQIQTIKRASGGDKNTAAAIAGYNSFITKQKGRHDLAPGAGALIGAVHDSIDGYQTSGEAGSTGAAYAAQLDENAWNSGGLYQIANGKSEATKNLTSHWEDQYSQALTSGDPAQLEKSTIALQEMKAMLPNTSGDNQLVLNKSIARMEAMRQERLESIPGYIAPGGAGNKPQQQVDMEASFEQIDKSASSRARTYKRDDEESARRASA